MAQLFSICRRRINRLVAILGIAILALIVYLVAYTLLLENQLPYRFEYGTDAHSDRVTSVELRPRYRIDSHWFESLMMPANYIDRMYRPGHWRISVGDPFDRVYEIFTSATGKLVYMQYHAGDATFFEIDGKVGMIYDRRP